MYLFVCYVYEVFFVAVVICSNVCVPAACGSWSLELEFPMVVSRHVDTGNQAKSSMVSALNR